MIQIITHRVKIRSFKYWTALADEATDTFISVCGHAVAGAGVVVIGFVIGCFAMAVVATS